MKNLELYVKAYKIIFNSDSLLLIFIRGIIKFGKRLTETSPETPSEMS